MRHSIGTMDTKLARRIATIAAIIPLLMLALAEQAHAVDRSATPSSSTPHCVVKVEPIRPGQATSKISAARCFRTFAEAMSQATGGALRLPRNMGPADVTETMLKQYEASRKAQFANGDVSAAGSWPVGQSWGHANFGGTSITFSSGDSRVCNGLTYGTNYASGWNNTISTARAWSNCAWHTQYDYSNFGGSRIDCGNNNTDCDYMGAMNDAATSWRAHGLV